MDAQQLAALKRHHDFDAWAAPDATANAFLVWRFFLGGRELPGWRVHRVQRIDVPGTPPAHHSVWQRADGRGRILLALDVYECASAAAAREFLVRVLAEFQSPQLERIRAVGEVAFTVPGEGAVVFARANLVVVLRNAGDETIPLGDLARRFDDGLRTPPRADAVPEGAPAIERFETEASAFPGRPMPLRLETAAGRVAWFKIYGPAGSLAVEDDRPVFRPAASGAQELVAFAITSEGASSTRTLRVEVQGGTS